MTVTATTVDLLRHGEPVGGRRYRGQRDDPLSPRGWAQMLTAVEAEGPWQAVVSSPLARCADFARALAAQRDLPLTLEPRLMEIGFGAWEGRTAAELTRDDPLRLLRFWNDPEGERPPGAEPLARFEARVLAAWEDCLAAAPGGRLLLVTHAGVIRLILTRVLGMPRQHLYRLQVPSAGLSRVEVLAGGGLRHARLLFHGRPPGSWK